MYFIFLEIHPAKLLRRFSYARIYLAKTYRNDMIYYISYNLPSNMKLRSGKHTCFLHTKPIRRFSGETANTCARTEHLNWQLHNNNITYDSENITIQLDEDFPEDDEGSLNEYTDSSEEVYYYTKSAKSHNHIIWLKHRISTLIELIYESTLMDQYRIGYELWAVIHEHLDFIMSIPLWKRATKKYFKGEIKNLKKTLYCLAYTPEQRTYLGYYRADLVKTLMIIEGTR